MKSETVKNLMNLYIANKKLGFDVSLKDIKKMTPEEGFLFIRQIQEAVQKFKEMRNNRGT